MIVQINQLKEQRDRAERDNKEEKELHEREVSDYKMKVHTLESEVRGFTMLLGGDGKAFFVG